MADKRVAVSIRLDRETIQKVDIRARAEKRTRSGMIRIMFEEAILDVNINKNPQEPPTSARV
jgi:predicted transcriptional regulator